MALENMAGAFKGLPMGDLIGGPLNAACEAQVRLASATVDFIRVVGFDAPKDPTKGAWSGETRTATFRFKRPVQIAPAQAPKMDPVDPTKVVTPGVPANIQVEDVEIQVPVLSIVKVPALTINKVDITFDMEVKSSESSKESEDKSGSLTAEASFGWGLFKGSVKIQGSIATHKENTRTSDNSAKYHVEVHAADNGMPEGLSRVLDILAQSVAPLRIGAAAATPP